MLVDQFTAGEPLRIRLGKDYRLAKPDSAINIDKSMTMTLSGEELTIRRSLGDVDALRISHRASQGDPELLRASLERSSNFLKH